MSGTSSPSGSYLNRRQPRGATPAPSQPTPSPTTTGPMHGAGAQPVNTQLPTPLMPVKNEALQKAIQEYVSQLSSDDKAAFQSAPDIIKRLREMQRNNKSSIPNSLTTRVERVLQCIKHFMGSLPIFIQQSPDISSLVVGGANCILTLVLGYIEFFERLTAMMERIGPHLSYLTEYSKATFKGSDELQKALVAAYCDLLEFYIRARKIFSKKKGQPSYIKGFKLFFKLTWEPFEAQFDPIEARFSNHTLTIVRLASIDHQNRTLEYQQREDEIRRLEQDTTEKKEAIKSRRKILSWLSSAEDFEETHERHFQKRFQNTGQWLLDNPRFIGWRDGVRSSLLWCHGAPGSGKTILASLVIEHLSALCERTAGTGITFIYCNFAESRTTTTYISLALKQLCRTMQSLPAKLHEVYQQHYQNDSQPRYDELRHIFLEIIRQLGHVFFVVDALDECTLNERRNLCKFLLSITDTASTGTSGSQGIVKLFVTSRKEPDIELAFRQQAIPKIEIEAAKVDNDIEVYVKAQIELRLQNGSLSIRDMALKNKILNALTKKAGGMFLWVEFQLDAICAEYSDNGIERALSRVPEDMNATYERILDAINKKPRTQRELARRALIWTTYSRMPLSIIDLTYFVSIDQDTKSLNDLESSIPTEKNIVDACANLISVDQSFGRYVRFIHFSVQEFLTSCPSTWIDALRIGYEVAHREIAQTCMVIQTRLPKSGTFPSFGTRHLIQHSPVALLQHHLHSYALDEWPHHLLAGSLNNLQVDDQIVALTLSFFDASPVVAIKTSKRFSEFSWYQKLEDNYLKFSTPVLALIFNLPLTQNYLQSHRKQLGAKQPKAIEDPHSNYIVSDDKLAMHYAAAELDSVPVAQRLYDNGYTANYSSCAIDRDPNKALSWLRLSPLFSIQGTQMARFLLGNGASVKLQKLHKHYADPLEFFARRGNLGVFRLLLDRLDVVDKNRERFRSILQGVVLVGNIVAIRLLLGKGIDINTQGGKYGSALQAAVYHGNVEAIRLLLDKGADVNIQGGKFGGTLQAAAYAGNVEVIQMLLDRGADINTQGGIYGSALQAAVYRDNVEAIQLLLDKGADVNIHWQGGQYGSALQAVVHGGDVKLIQLLLDKGADVNIQGGEYGSALQAAVSNVDVEVIQQLLDKGADVNIQGGKYGSTLQAAVYRGNVEVIQLLLGKGADVNIQGGMYGSALQAAVSDGNVEVIQLLLDKGADVNIQGGKFGGTLQAAAYAGNVEVTRLLLDNGADVHARGGEYGTVFQAALAPHDWTWKQRSGTFSIVELLLDYGADITTHVPDSKYGDAFTAAKELWKEDKESLDGFMKLLVSWGRKGDLALRGRKRDETEGGEDLLEGSQQPKRGRI